MTTDPAHPGGRRAGKCREQDGPDRHGARADGSQLSSTASPPVSLSEAGGRPTDSDSPQTPAQRWDALVVGGGIAGLTAAWDLVRAGLRPLLVEARGYTGGLVAAGRIGGARLDLGAEGFVVRGEAATSMLGELGLRTTGPHGRPRLRPVTTWARRAEPMTETSRPAGRCTGFPTTPTWGSLRTHWRPTS